MDLRLGGGLSRSDFLKHSCEPSTTSATKEQLKGKNMSSFALTSGAHYNKSLNVFITKSGERTKNFEILQEHMPSFIQRLSLSRLPRPCINILSVGSGTGEKGMDN